MADINGLVDPSVAPATGSADMIPAGEYVAHLVGSEMKPNSKGTGQILHLDFAILEGQYAHTHQFHRLNLVNPNPQAVQIAKGELNAIIDATGPHHAPITNSEMLHFKPMLLQVKVVPPSTGADGKQYGAKNEIGAFKKASGARPAQGGFQPPRAQAPQAMQQPTHPPHAGYQAAPQQPQQPPDNYYQPPGQPAPQQATGGAPPWGAQRA